MNLRPYQREAVAQIVAGRRTLFADPPGTGKTISSLVALDWWHARRALILAPSYVLSRWTDEAPRWSPDRHMVLGTGTAAARSRARDEFLRSPGPAALVLNYEAARIDIEHLLKLKCDTLIADESHWMVEMGNALFKRVAKIARRVDNLLLVTGTPMLNGVEDLWTSLHMMAPKGYTSFWRWAHEHFEVEHTDFHGKIARPVQLVGELKPGKGASLRKDVEGHFICRPLRSLLPDLPELEVVRHMVTLSKEERAAYDELERRKMGTVGTTAYQMVNKVSTMTRLRQLASEWSQLSEELGDGTKVQWANKLLRSGLPDEQLVAVAGFRHTVNRLSADEHVHGGVTPKQRREALDRFRTEPGTVLAGTLDTLGEGIDGLQVANQMVMVDRAWNPARNDQVMGRIFRSGQQASKVRVHQIIAKDTVDQHMDDVLEFKRSQIAQVLEAS